MINISLKNSQTSFFSSLSSNLKQFSNLIGIHIFTYLERFYFVFIIMDTRIIINAGKSHLQSNLGSLIFIFNVALNVNISFSWIPIFEYFFAVLSTGSDIPRRGLRGLQMLGVRSNS